MIPISERLSFLFLPAASIPYDVTHESHDVHPCDQESCHEDLHDLSSSVLSPTVHSCKIAAIVPDLINAGRTTAHRCLEIMGLDRTSAA